MSFFEELKRRKVFRVAASYGVVAFIIMQLVEILFPMFNFPQWTQQFTVIIVLLGFPIALILSWMFDKTPQGYLKTDVSTQTSSIEGQKKQPFYKLKRNWILLTGVMAGLLIGWYGGGAGYNLIEVPESINEKSIAVLPFENLGKEGEDEYFADGMTEDILTELSKIKDLLVISRTTIMKYKNTNKSLTEIGKELGVANILEGSIRRVGDRVRITGQLINAFNDQHLWAEKYDRNIEDIFEVQDEVASAIANALRIELSDEEAQSIARKQTTSIEAYELYSKARALRYTYEMPKVEEAVQLYKKAIKLDKSFALAYAGISSARVTQSYYLWRELDKINFFLNEGKKYAEIAIELAPNDADAHFAMGFYQLRVDDAEGAYNSQKTAIKLNPSHAHAHDEIGDVYNYKYGDLDRALFWYGKALKRDPALIPANTYTIEIALKKGQVNKALDLVDKAIKMHPRAADFIILKSEALIISKKYENAYNFLNKNKILFIEANNLEQFFYLKARIEWEMNNKTDYLKTITKFTTLSSSTIYQQQLYLEGVELFFNGKYKQSITKFDDMFDRADLIFQKSGQKRVWEDICHYWKAISLIELGEYQKAIDETRFFRPSHNELTYELILDEFWPKKDYLRGLAYEGLGDYQNARENYEEFLKVWYQADESLPEIIDAKKRLRNLGWNS
jgi:TolB-like protein/Tfp pilus assembly protein PilF|tara:strand:- start:346 stop:2379 length:2034 start_codon:yes stop_codon:yes gene_type:complete